VKTVVLPLPPIGVKIFTNEPKWLTPQMHYRGISFCAAIGEATVGEPRWVAPDSIDTCHWSLAGLGFKEPVTAFVTDIEPRLPLGTAGLFIARLDRFPAGLTPDVVLVRAPAEILRRLAALCGWERAAWDQVEEKRIAKSALKVLKENRHTWRSQLTQPLNRVLGGLERIRGWKELTVFVFNSSRASAALERLLKRATASMSMCRNSVVIPFLTGRFNVSYFCTGGVTWGGNYPLYLTSGWPWPLWQELASKIAWEQ